MMSPWSNSSRWEEIPTLKNDVYNKTRVDKMLTSTSQTRDAALQASENSFTNNNIMRTAHFSRQFYFARQWISLKKQMV